MIIGLIGLILPLTQSRAALPGLNLAPASAVVGATISVSGSDLPGNTMVQLQLDSLSADMPQAHVTGSGVLRASFIVPSVGVGAHIVSARAVTRDRRRSGSELGNVLATATLVVLDEASLATPAVAAAVASPGASTPASQTENATPTATAVVTADPTAVVTADPTAVVTPQPTPTRTPAPTPKPTPTPTPKPTPTPTPRPPTPAPALAGLPYIDPSYGTLLRKVFTDGTLGPFKVLTYPDDHIGGAGQDMTVYNRFSNGAAQTSVHDGYLELRATRRPDGLWNAALVGTSMDGNGPTFGYGVYRFWLRFNIAPQTWQAAWLYDTTSWSSTEIDYPEVLEKQSLTAHVLGSGAGALYGLPKPSNLATSFHEFKIVRRATFVAFYIDGVKVGQINGTMPNKKLAILLDSKVGWPWMGASGAPSSSTPSVVYLDVAAVTVDP